VVCKKYCTLRGRHPPLLQDAEQGLQANAPWLVEFTPRLQLPFPSVMGLSFDILGERSWFVSPRH
jgi:hypothetical protein